MPEPTTPTAYSSLRVLIEITSFLFIGVAVIWLLYTVKILGFFAIAQVGLFILSILVLKGLAHALLDIADAHRRG